MPNSKDKLTRVLSQLQERDTRRFRIEEHLFPEQLAFVNDPDRFATAVCSRRAGKTIACAADLVDTALKKPGAACLYITLSRAAAKRIVWEELKALVRDYGLGGRVNESDLSIRFKNRSVIYVSGASDRSEIEKFRGLALALVYIDEAQGFRSYIEELVDDVLAKALFDYNGRLRLTGTPGPIPAGYFFEASTRGKWSNHHWTMFQNPWIERKSGKTPRQLLDEDNTRKGLTDASPTTQREGFGQWVVDSNSLVFHYDASINAEDAPGSLDSFILGVDLGYDDADAIAVIGWAKNSPKAYLVEEDVTRKQSISELAAKLQKFIDRYQPMKVVVDTGALGKKIVDELRKRFGLPLEAADKHRKYEYVEILNDALRSGRLHARPDSIFAHDSTMLEWDMDKTNGDRLVVSDRFHSDITDAVLYAYREALSWLYKPEEAPVAKFSDAYWARIEAEAFEAALQATKPNNEDVVMKGFSPFDPFDPRSE